MIQSSHISKTSNDSLKEILDSMYSENFDTETNKKLETIHSLCAHEDTNVNAQYPNGDNAFLLSPKKGLFNVAGHFLKEAKVKADINFTDPEGNTALMLSIQEDNANMALMLISLDADLNIINNQGETALKLAI